jgi:hypothetical protein
MIECTENVPSLVRHHVSRATSAPAYSSESSQYGEPSATCGPSAIIVPKTATMRTVIQ